MNDMNTDRALSWDDEFTNEQQEFVPALRAAPSCRPAPWQS